MRFAQPWLVWAVLPGLVVLVLSALKRRALVGRGLTLLLLGLALAEPELALRSRQETVAFLVDRSTSVGEEGAKALDVMVGEVRRRGAQTLVVSFGARAQVEGPGLPGAAVGVEPGGTHIAGALDLALALLPDEGAQVVLISDGRATAGDELGAAARARRQEVPVHVVPVGRADWARLAGFAGPREAPMAELRFTFTVEATRPTSGRIVLRRGAEVVGDLPVDLPAGIMRWELGDVPPGPGIYIYRGELVVTGDPFPENNVLFWGVRVGDPPRVLVVGPRPSALDELLKWAGWPFRRVDVLRPSDLGGVGLVILDDLPLGLVSEAAVGALRAFVSGGGGLWVIQGRRAVSGYAGGVEALLPVTYVVPERLQQATAAVVFVLDRSASMAATSQGVPKIDLLKEATAAAVEALAPEDVVGAMAFDTTYYWLVQPGPVEEVAGALFRGLKTLTASGGTDLYPAVREAVGALARVQARVRQLFVISDGKTLRGTYDFQSLYAEVAASGVGVTAIGIGEDADTEILQGLARAGQGRLFLLAGMNELRPILVQEAERVSRPRFVERETPVLLGPGAASVGLENLSLPSLQGFTLTFPKPTAEVVLLTPAGDPILALWTLGLGRVGVLNADLSGIWTREWFGSPGLGAWLGPWLGALWRDRASMELSWAVDDERIRLELDVEEGGGWVNGLRFAGELAGPGGSVGLEFFQVAPGKYAASSPRLPSGVYALSLAEATGRFGGTFLISVPYPREYERVGPDREALRRLADLTGGQVVEDEVVPPLAGGVREGWPLARPLLWAAAAGFLVDLLVRKLVG